MKLFFAPGACSRVPLVALEKCGAPFETELIAFMRGDHRQADFLRLNPSGKIPVLISEDQVIAQNAAILTYLADTYPDAGLLPPASGALERALHLSQLLRFSADIHPLVTRIRMPQFFCDLEGAPPRVKELATEAITFQLASLERTLEKSDWLLGDDDWGALDIYLHWVWFRITGAGFDPASFPAIANHFSRTLEIPAFNAAINREEDAQRWLDDNGFAVKFAGN